MAAGLTSIILVAGLIAGMFVHSYKAAPAEQAKAAPGDAITFDEFLARSFSARYFNGSWWSENELQWKDLDGNLVKWNIETNETSIIVSQDLLSSVSEGTRFMGFSPDNTMILFAYDIESVWRHSFTARYLVLDTVSNQTVEVRTSGGEDRLQYCDWVFNDEDANTLIFVYGNNLYWRSDALDSNGDSDLAITNDGDTDNVFNGIPDWVYEEEVLSSNYAHYINTDGSKVAFVRFNDTLVPDFRYPSYGNPNNVYDAQYPEYRVVRYPKSGEVNPTITLFVRDVAETGNKEIRPPADVTQWGEYIFTDITWVSWDTLSVTWMNRIQNESTISQCQEEGGVWICRTAFSQRQEGGWIEIAPSPMYNEAGTEFVAIIPSLDLTQGRHYKHVARVTVSSGVAASLSAGAMVVTEVHAWDEVTGTVYFTATEAGRPGSRHLYKVMDNGEGQTCLTCTLLTSRNENCQSNEVDINVDNTFYVHTCRGQGIPEVSLRRLSDGNLVYLLEDNQQLEAKLQEKQLPIREDMSIALDSGFTAPVKLLRPPHLQEGEQYPVLVYVYGGPGSQMVDDRWSVGWNEYLTTSRNIILVVIDGRGTGLQSDEHLYTVYRNLGTVEMEDQIAVTRQLVGMKSYMDPDRVAIWGWSYGGFATLMTLEQDVGPTPVFSCGISVAPVTSWLLYDSIYTERYMALPSDNSLGYNHSAINGIENLRTKQWMLNHGVADDNVHYQHTMLLTRALEQADIQFTQHSYPDENHSLGGVSRFLYHAMDDFWTSCFDLEPVEH